MSTATPLSSYWRHRASTILPLSSATISNAPAASGTFVTVTELPITLSSIPTSSLIAPSSSSSLSTSASSSTQTLLASPSTSTSTSTFVPSSVLPTSSPFSPIATPGLATSEEGVAPMSNSYKYIILSVFGALLVGMCLCLYAARLRRRSSARKEARDDYSKEEEGNEKPTRPNTTFGEYGKGRWSRRLTFKIGPDKIWKRLKDYENSVKARANNDSHIPSLPPPALTREEASFTVPTFYHAQPQGLPLDYDELADSNSLREVNQDQGIRPNYTMLTRKPTVKLEPRIESQMAEERNTNDLSLSEMFDVDLDGVEEDQQAISPFDDNIYEDHQYAQPGIHALTHSLTSSSSRERINTSAYPSHPPAPALEATSLLAVPEAMTDPFAEEIDSTTLGNAMLAVSPSPLSIKRKPVPVTENIETVAPTSNLLSPDYIASTSSVQPKRVTYRSPTESIYGCYQADDDRSASFVDFSVSPKTIV